MRPKNNYKKICSQCRLKHIIKRENNICSYCKSRKGYQKVARRNKMEIKTKMEYRFSKEEREVPSKEN